MKKICTEDEHQEPNTHTESIQTEIITELDGENYTTGKVAHFTQKHKIWEVQIKDPAITIVQLLIPVVAEHVQKKSHLVDCTITCPVFMLVFQNL